MLTDDQRGIGNLAGFKRRSTVCDSGMRGYYAYRGGAGRDEGHNVGPLDEGMTGSEGLSVFLLHSSILSEGLIKSASFYHFSPSRTCNRSCLFLHVFLRF